MPKTAQPPRLSNTVRGSTYYVVWRDEEQRRTRRQCLYTTDAREATLRLAEWIVQTNGGAKPLGGDATRGLTVAEAVDRYLAEHGPKLADIATARKRLARVLAFMGGKLLSNVGPDLCRAYAAHRDCTSGAVRGELAYLVAAANHCLKWKHIDRGQLPVVELPKAAAPRDAWIRLDQLDDVLEHASRVWQADATPEGGVWRPLTDADRLPRIYRFVMLAYYTASRRTALETLRWEQVDFEHLLIHLNPTGRQQTRKRRPTVPIHSRLLPVLERAHRERVSEFVLDHAGSIRKAHDRLVERAKLPADITPHAWRHTRATHLDIRGVPANRIADLLGDTLATVEKTYRHQSHNHLREALEGV